MVAEDAKLEEEKADIVEESTVPVTEVEAKVEETIDDKQEEAVVQGSPEFLEMPQDMIVQEGETIKLCCKVQGLLLYLHLFRDYVTIVWYFCNIYQFHKSLKYKGQIQEY